jgi:PAS domain S-box-containing protein
MFGYTVEDWRTMDRWLETVHPDDRDPMRAFTSAAVGDGDPFEIEYRIVRRDGIVRWVRAQGAVVLRDASGRAKEYQGVVVDVTSSRQAQEKRLEALALYRTLVEQIPAATYIELAGQPPGEVHLAYISPQAAAIFGRSAEELMADPRHFADALHPDDRGRPRRRRPPARGRPFDEIPDRSPDGSFTRSAQLGHPRARRRQDAVLAASRSTSPQRAR